MPDQLSSIKSLLELQDSLQKQDPNREMGANPAAREILTQISGLRLLRDRLQDIGEMKKSGGFGTNTGPLIGGWKPLGGYDSQGNPAAPNAISKILSLIKPDASVKRSALQNALNQAGTYGFDIGGKQLTGTEKSTTNAMIPNMYQEDDSFMNTINNSVGHEIPRILQEKAKALLDLGYDENAVRKMIQSSIK